MSGEDFLSYVAQPPGLAKSLGPDHWSGSRTQFAVDRIPQLQSGSAKMVRDPKNIFNGEDNFLFCGAQPPPSADPGGLSEGPQAPTPPATIPFPSRPLFP